MYLLSWFFFHTFWLLMTMPWPEFKKSRDRDGHHQKAGADDRVGVSRHKPPPPGKWENISPKLRCWPTNQRNSPYSRWEHCSPSSESSPSWSLVCWYSEIELDQSPRTYKSELWTFDDEKQTVNLNRWFPRNTIKYSFIIHRLRCVERYWKMLLRELRPWERSEVYIM